MTFTKLPHIGQKLGALLVMTFITVVCALFMHPDRLSAISITFVGMYAAFCGSRAYTETQLAKPCDKDAD